MDLTALYRAAGRAVPEEDSPAVSAVPAPSVPAAPPVAPAPAPNPELETSGDPHGLTLDELRRACYPDEWEQFRDNPAAMGAFSRSLGRTSLWAVSCERTAGEWAVLASEPGPGPEQPAICGLCRFWSADPINPAGGLGACRVPVPEPERLRRYPTAWPHQPGCPHGRPIGEEPSDAGPTG